MTIKFTWFGTASYILDFDGIRLLFDPFFYRNSQSTPKLKTKKEKIKNIEALFISHGHFDHATDAGWFAENLNIPVYCSEVAKENMINWADGKILEEEYYPISKKGKDNIKPCENFDKIQVLENIEVELIKSEHIKFDFNTVASRLFSWKIWKQIGKMSKFGKGFPMGNVFGFCTQYNERSIVAFGSLWHEYEEILKKYENCDVFIAPLAGNSRKNIAKKGGKMVDILKPKIVIPVHWDNFFPPISRTEDLGPFFEYMEINHPNIKIIVPEIDNEIKIDLK